MRVMLNGVETDLTDAITVAALLTQLELTGRIAVEINQLIVPSGEFDTHPIRNGDTIEIVHAIGGG